MLVTAAFCPASPLLVPRVGRGAGDGVAALRERSHEVLDALLAAEPDLVVVVASGASRTWPAAPATFARLGLADPPADGRPLALHVGAALLAEHAWSGEVVVRSVDDGEAPALDERRVGVLCLGDGSARRSTAAPGYLHPEAEPYDERVATALATVDTGGLLALDAADDARLLVDGRRAWQWTARAFAAQPGEVHADFLTHAAPHGVGSFVARWWP